MKRIFKKFLHDSRIFLFITKMQYESPLYIFLPEEIEFEFKFYNSFTSIIYIFRLIHIIYARINLIVIHFLSMEHGTIHETNSPRIYSHEFNPNPLRSLRKKGVGGKSGGPSIRTKGWPVSDKVMDRR